MRILAVIVAAALCLSACGEDAQQDVTRIKDGRNGKAAAGPAGVPATRTTRLDFASCLAEDVAEDAARATRCPSFALLSLDYLGSQCAANNGTLKAIQPSQAWSLDVDGDASAEVLVDLVANFDCEGAPGVFTCGSGGCPFLLFKKRGETWVELGAINADEGPGIEVLPAESGKYSALRGGCLGQQPCSEYAYYEWDGGAYARKWIDFKGHAVDVTAGGLMTLTSDTAVHDAPGGRRAQVLDEYPAGTTVIAIGTARDAPYTFVSPCNGCRRGFVETALLSK